MTMFIYLSRRNLVNLTEFYHKTNFVLLIKTFLCLQEAMFSSLKCSETLRALGGEPARAREVPWSPS